MSIYTSLTGIHFWQLPKEDQPGLGLTDDSLAVGFHQQSPHPHLSAPSHITLLSGFQISETWRGCIFGWVSAPSYQGMKDTTTHYGGKYQGPDISDPRLKSSELVSLLCLLLFCLYSSTLNTQYTHWSQCFKGQSRNCYWGLLNEAFTYVLSRNLNILSSWAKDTQLAVLLLPFPWAVPWTPLSAAGFSLLPSMADLGDLFCYAMVQICLLGRAA